MKRNLKKTMDNTPNAKYKVVEVTKDHYKLENGDIFEHTFDIDDDITVEEFQAMLDNARKIMENIIDE